MLFVTGTGRCFGLIFETALPCRVGISWWCIMVITLTLHGFSMRSWKHNSTLFFYHDFLANFKVKWTIDRRNKTVSKASLPSSTSLMEKPSDHRITQMTKNCGTWGWCWLEGLAGFSSENKCCAGGEWTTLTLCAMLCFAWGRCLPYSGPAVEDSADDFRWPQRSWYSHTSFLFFVF